MCLDQAEAAWSALYEILSLYLSATLSSKTSTVESQVKRLCIVQSLELSRLRVFEAFIKGEGEDFLKLNFNKLMCEALREGEFVAVPQPLFSGVLKKLIRGRMLSARTGNARNLGFFYSLLQSKRKWLQMSEDKEMKSIQKHQVNMTAEPKPLGNIMRTAIQIAVRLVIPKKYRPGKCLPTFSSCLESGRKDGGNHGVTSIGATIDARLVPLGNAPTAFSRLQFETSLKAALSDEVRHIVEVQSLPEPGKFRIITKGPAHLYTACRPFQSFLIDAWKKCPYGTMNDTWDTSFASKIARFKCSGGRKWVSGDYSAATDKLSWEASKYTMDTILEYLDDLPEETRQLVGKAWTPAYIYYGRKSWRSLQDSVREDLLRTGVGKSGKQEVFLQSNGQLMGHPLSFPVLCLINLATAIAGELQSTGAYGSDESLELIPDVLTCKRKIWAPYAKRVRTILYDKALIVNGDDIVFLGSSRDYARWKGYSSSVGLELSLGKNYYSNVAVMINSKLFDAMTGNRIGYCNTALAAGHRLKSEPRITMRTIAAIDERLRDSLPGDLAKQMRKRFFRTHHVLLKTHLNWFVSPQLGGLGLPNLRQKKIYVSDEQRRIALRMRDNPLFGVIFEKLDELPPGAMRALRVAAKVLPPIKYQGKVQGPLRKEEDCAVAEKMLMQILAAYAYTPGPPKEGEYERKILHVRKGGMMKCKEVREWTGKRRQLSALYDPHPDAGYSTYEVRTDSFWADKTSGPQAGV